MSNTPCTNHNCCYRYFILNVFLDMVSFVRVSKLASIGLNWCEFAYLFTPTKKNGNISVEEEVFRLIVYELLYLTEIIFGI